VVKFLNIQPERSFYTLDFRMDSKVAPFTTFGESTKPFFTTDNGTFPYEPPEFCDEEVRDRYTYAGKYWGTSTKFTFDRMEWIEGKQAPLYAAYYRAAHTSAVLRNTIEQAKYSLGQPIMIMNGCSSKLAGHDLYKTDIVIPEAPAITISYIRTIRNMVGYSRESINDRVTVAFHKAPAFVITGMCLAKDCQPEDLQFTNDRNITGPTVSPRQQRVIDELEKMQSDDFWLAAAHRNGVYDRYNDIRYVAKQNRETLARDIPPTPISAALCWDHTYFNPFMFFFLKVVPAIVFLIVVKRWNSRLLRRRRQAGVEVISPRQPETVVDVPPGTRGEIIPPPVTAPQQPQLQEAGLAGELKLQLQEFGLTLAQVEEHMNERMAAFSTMVSTLPQGHPFREQAKQTFEEAEETARTMAETKRLLKELNRYL
jgi:hypothetical protein